ncbi:Succinate dehydrogenase iron-sulfur protein [Richelia intracellularis HH01]|uniref:Fumarate reductase iron-sulfur subunit n=1 Tax=Richelia intracellularis HH01 TaxID=1165094 RepID=M1X5V6_9NOST|nr:succinate dehydrogenase/fumarate reductase iron-sulfur subunit [Richelia intracellularis]CCH67641.1 Succinate dehydrogenase iron-sulfur protein [Richelia intracellularis HH01]HAE06091.1 succinate dehydrogenase/fumarate reductase iron-sulfur subunit [Richelia sp.]
MQIIFKVLRQQQNSAPNSKEYLLDTQPSSTILDCLNHIKWNIDGTLAFRKNCRNTICGSCAMKINGRSTLACKENVGSELAKLGHNFSTKNVEDKIPEITIAPLGNLPVIKDLVVDMRSFWDNLEKIVPYVNTTSENLPDREFLQTPQERSKLDQVSNCIMCGACYSECNAVEVNPDFAGPHALAKGYRNFADPRDDEHQKRLEEYNTGTKGIWGCTRCHYCNSICPMGVAPMDQITKIKREILAAKTKNESRPIRHRRVLTELVKTGGWIDERQFGLQLTSNYFRDIRGLLSIAPLGLRMIAKGKFPFSFEPSEGVEQVRALMNAAQEQKDQD